MPPKKAAPNGFFIYMQEQQGHIRKATGRAPSMREMPGHCREGWNNMSPQQRSVYDQRAKQMKRELAPNPDCVRKDNQRQYISERRDPVKENERRRLQENQKMRTEWRGQDLLNMKFHIINLQVMFSDETEEYRLPVEIGMVRITLKEGKDHFVHRFINPGEAPEGYRSMAMQHSENTHQIPLNFKDADGDMRSLWKQIETFLAEDPENDDIPPVFCLSKEREDVEICLEYIHHRAGVRGPNRVHKVYCLEDMVASLIMLTKPGSAEPSKTQLMDAMQQNRWDYRSDIRCFFHEEQDCAYCALSIVRRYSFAVFDTLSSVLNFKLTGNHMPDETESFNTVFHPALPEDNTRDRLSDRYDRQNNRYDRYRDNEMRTTTQRVANLTVREPRPQPPTQPPAPHPFPTQKRIEIQLSSEESCSDEDDDDDDDDVLNSEEIKLSVDKYQLKELRLPKTVSMVQAEGDSTTGGEAAGSEISSRDSVKAVPGSMNMLGMGMLGRGRPPTDAGAAAQPEMRPPPGFPSLATIRGPALPPAPILGSAWASVAAQPPGTAPRPLSFTPLNPSGTNRLPMGRGVLASRGRAPQGPGGELPMGRGKMVPMGRGFSSGN